MERDAASDEGEPAGAGSDPVDHRQGDAARESMLLLSSLRIRTDPNPMPISIRIRNLSAGGLMAECALRFARGECVEVGLRGIGSVSGAIAWSGNGRLGIAFDRMINPKMARRPVGVGTAMMTSKIIVMQRSRRSGLRME